jgi:hypothetical protein
MAATYTIAANGVAWAAGKNMLAISNHTGSGKIVRVYRMWLHNVATSAVTGGMCVSQLDRCASVASFTAGTAITPSKHDSTSAAIPAQILVNTGTSTTLTRSGTYRTVLWANDELVLADATLEGFGAVIPFGLIWDSGYGNSTVQPITLREGEGLVLYTPAAGGGTYVGTVEIYAEVTIT